MGALSWAWAGLGVAPPLAILFWVLRSSWAPVVQLRERLDPVIQSFFGAWSIWELGILAFVAGLSEEVLFRGVIQAGLEAWLGPSAGLVIAAVLFGLMHPITRLYILLTLSIGFWLGLVWMWSGDLLAPVLAHGVYDFVALIVCVQRARKTEGF
jgi:membrane protease YdiL (CAAX protease family)